ncbi:MAG TPA: hypothetical protein VNT25_06875 [Allosphingosinicella sp.]|nr:hypothetical protein [Allosphingosinicella sp.]
MIANVQNGGGGAKLPWRLAWGIVPIILLIPLIGNWPWTFSDYVFATVLMGMVGLGLELAARKGNRAYSAGAGLALAASFMLIWINGAVGIIGSEDEPANLLFLGMVLVALLGSIAGLFRPAGMVRAMTAAAIAQALVPVAALVLRPGARASIFQPEVLVLTIFFVGMWLAAAALFRRATDR